MKVSQRTAGFNGGIQSGTTAYDDKSKKLDVSLKESRDAIIGTNNLSCKKRFVKEDKTKYVGDDCFGFEPDGGAWFLGDKLVAVFEAKKQGLKGNANERWFKNAIIAKHINPDVKYVTFCSGEGAREGEVFDKMRRLAEITMGENYSFVLSPDGFTPEEVKAKMIDTLARCV